MKDKKHRRSRPIEEREKLSWKSKKHNNIAPGGGVPDNGAG